MGDKYQIIEAQPTLEIQLVWRALRRGGIAFHYQPVTRGFAGETMGCEETISFNDTGGADGGADRAESGDCGKDERPEDRTAAEAIDRRGHATDS